MHVIVIGGGILGTVGAIELRRRGHDVVLIDRTALPHADAASTDISKVCRMEYGPDDGYMTLMARAWDGWHAWNDRWVAAGHDPLYHPCGVLMVRRDPMEPGSFEWESYRRLIDRGYRPERLDDDALRARFPAWTTGQYVDGFFHAVGGFAESGRVVERLLDDARRDGVETRTGCGVAAIRRTGDVTNGVVLEDGTPLDAEAVLVAAGCWTQRLVPTLAPFMKATGHPVVHLRPTDPTRFTADRFPVFTADIARTGLYGFPLHPREHVVKVALHDTGAPIDPTAPRVVTDEQIARIRALLAETVPSLADADVVFTRLCAYSDTVDEDFLIARDPDDSGLTVAAGGSGHAFKFAPILGALIADAVEGVANPDLSRFAWNRRVDPDRREAARFHDRG